MSKRSILAILFLVVWISGCSLPKLSIFPEEGPLKETTLQGSAEEKILVLSIDGIISDQPDERLLRSNPSMVQKVVAQLRRAEKDSKIKALLLKVNSPGGAVTASDILYHEIMAYKQRTGVKVIAAMMNVAASGGYYISLPADWIVAHPTTITGSVGVIFARPGVSGLMEKVGLSMQVTKSGILKDMGSPFRPPTEAEQAIFQELTFTLAGRFLDLVDKHRALQPEQREQVATARVFLPDDALALKLVDQIGYLNDAIEKAKDLAGLGPEARVITFRRQPSENDTIYNSAGAVQGGALENVPGLAPLSHVTEAGFYYIWPSAL